MNTKNCRYFIFMFVCLVGIVRADEKDEKKTIKNGLSRPIFYSSIREEYHELKKKKKKQKNIKKKKARCVFCSDMNKNEDDKNLIVMRFKHCTVFLSLFPYKKGHLLIVPYAHEKDFEGLSPEARQEIMEIIAAIPSIFRKHFQADGTNIGINIGSAAGASPGGSCSYSCASTA